MPAKSKKQQQFFGMVRACQKGEMENPSKKIQDVADSMSKKDVKDFASTKHKGLPNKVKKHKTNESVIKIDETDLKNIIKESVNKILSEISFSNYDNPEVRRNYLDGDEFSNDDYDFEKCGPEFDYDEKRYDELLDLKHRGLLTDEELDAIRDKFGY